MSYNSETRIIIAPVDTADIAAAIGVASGDVGTLCASDRVNKWALCKSMRNSSKSTITMEQRIAGHCGLSPVSVDKMLTQSVGAETSASTDYTIDECIAEVDEWPYLQPRGLSNYDEPYRVTDFDGYKGNAVPPDNGWSQMDISKEVLAELAATTMDVTDTGDYAGYNFKIVPQYAGAECNDGLYTFFSMLLGASSGESVGGNTDNMDIPIEYITSLDGYWRLALAVWVPNFGEHGGWGFFSSRMTIAQYFAESGAGTAMKNLFPDLATNPFVASLMKNCVEDQGGYYSFQVVPLLVENIGITYVNGSFCLRAVSDVTKAYSVPSGAKNIPFAVGEPPMTLYYQLNYELEDGVYKAFITNTDTEASHSYTYVVTRIVGGVQQDPNAAVTVTLAAGEKRQVAGIASQAGNSVYVEITAQDGVTIK